MKFSQQLRSQKPFVSIVVAGALFGLFGLTTSAANADSNETSSSSSDSYIQSAISAGGNSTCVVESGAAQCWGDNTNGQLGNGSTVSSSSPVAVSGLSSGVTAISVGTNHACAVVSGAVKCWGANESGQLGNGSTTASLTPVSVTGLTSGVTAVSVGGSVYSSSNRSSNYSCAVVSGAVKCWGANGSGQLGDGSTTASSTPVPVSGLTSGVTAISAGGSSGYSSDAVHTCAVVSGAATCWGANANGQLGDNSLVARTSPVQVIGLTSGVTAISVGGGVGMMGGSTSFSCAVVSGAATCWGANGSGQLGDSSTTTRLTPVQVTNLTTGVTSISTGNTHSCALVTGAVKCWGANSNGQLGNGAKSYSATSTAVSATGFSSGITAVSLGYVHSCAVTSTTVKCWGGNSLGQSGPSTFAVTQVAGLTSGVTALSAGLNNTSNVCAIQFGGLKCWGDNTYGQVGDGTNTYATSPQQAVGLTSGVTAVHGISCAVVFGAAQCWGNSIYSRLSANSSTPSVVHSLSSGVTAISGSLSPCVVQLGAAKCWGFGAYGALGNGSTSNATIPVQVTGLTSNVTAISGSENSTCAIQGGAAKCWGYNSYGQVGNGSTVQTNSPAQVTGLDSGVTAISIGFNHACAIVYGGLKCWGSGGSGQLGNGTTTNATSPVQVTGLTDGVTAVATGETVTCAIVFGALKCWGGDPALLGNGSSNLVSSPKDVLGMSSGVTAVALSRYVACAVKGGAAKCWGDNTSGVLGDGAPGANDYFNLTTAQTIDGIGPLTTTSTTPTSSTTTTVPSVTTTVPPAITTTTVRGATTTTVVVSASPTVPQGQASVATVAPTGGTTTTVLTPMKTQVPIKTSTTIPQVVTTIAGSPRAKAPKAPAVTPGTAGALINGKAISSKISRADNQVTVAAGDMTATISGLTSDGKRVALDAEGNLVVKKGQQLVINVTGFATKSPLTVWMYSTPTQLGEITTTSDGTAAGTFDLPAELDAGMHRAVLEGKTKDGEAAVIAIGITYGAEKSGSSLARVLIAIPVALAILFGLLLPAVSRRRKREVVA